ncbi:L,D-transpeptidase family protein [Phyllobacterium sp. SB3]|uniref:L,D-transpeptidase family protein n=1 Tax=Phyllobacterium sp. SB3 TaxID=3156073 RepID=UPI0032AF4C57
MVRRNLSLLIICLITMWATFAYGGATVDLVRVEKSLRKMQLLSGSTVVKEYKIALGARPVGHKRWEGDERTPEGRYILDWRNPKSMAHKSIHISYPNAQDKAAAKSMGVSPGGAIMIHGAVNGYGWWGWVLQLIDWTDGCIAVTNPEMDEIWTLVQDGTPIEIYP